MKKLLFSLVLVLALFTSCADSKVIDGVRYRPYGLMNADDVKNDSIRYVASSGSIILSIVFIETVIAPVYILGFDTMEPVNKCDPKLKGVIK